MKGCESALVYSSGYATNLGVVRTMLGKNDIAILDMFSHASLIDGTLSTEALTVFFKHNDMNSLEYLLKRARKDYLNKLVIVDL